MGSIRQAWSRLIEGRWAQNVVGRVATPKDRRLQESMDMEKLCYLAAVWNAPSQAHQHLLKIKATPLRDQQRIVAMHVQRQVLSVATILHSALQQAGEQPAAAQGMLRAHAKLMARAEWEEESDVEEEEKAPVSKAVPITDSGRMSQLQLSEHLLSKQGHSLHISKSTVPHPDAGDGLFLRGEARAGTVVALVPGVSYARTQLNHMPHYPKIDLDNDFLSSRYDYTILDSKPWGRGDAAGQSTSAASTSGRPWPVVTGPAAEYLSALEGRHPLALGHMVNHPGPGQHPNVLEVAFDISFHKSHREPWLRAYIPVVPYLEPGICDAHMAVLAASGWSAPGWRAPRPPASVLTAGSTVRGLALVALRGIKDGEELLHNYRLNPAAPRPHWYTSYNEEEERRRWAKPAYSSLI